MEPKTIFKGLKVIELASVLAGPAVGMFFAELGAEVLKVENKTSRGDITRSWKLASEDKSHPFSAYYSSVNFGKKSIFWNLKNPEDYEQLLLQLKTADIVICNFRPGDAKKFQLDFESVKAINPTVIYGEITGFGKVNRLAYDIVLQAEAGYISMNGEQKNREVKLPVAFIDLFAAHQLKEGILIAMLQKAKKDTAYCISVSLFDAAISALANQATNWLMGNHIAEPLGMLHPNIAPYGERFTCADQKDIVLAIGSDAQFGKLCHVLGLDEIHKDVLFTSNQLRVENRKLLFEKLAPCFLKHKRQELMCLFIDNNVPAGAIRNMQEVFELENAKKQIISEQKEGKKLTSIKGNVFTISC
ncbi:MAG: CoA transferase [Flavobacteriales bacterium]|nr:CoA transferase [Flavobacteriales bacterium]